MPGSIQALRSKQQRTDVALQERTLLFGGREHDTLDCDEKEQFSVLPAQQKCLQSDGMSPSPQSQ